MENRRSEMPVYLKDIDNFKELEKFSSVLIVPCRFCPAASFAVQHNEPYFEFFRKFLKTASYEKYIETMRSYLQKKGKKADVFKSHMPHQFVVCMWTSRRRKSLMRRAMKYDALVVLGCEAAVQTIYDAVKSTSCQVYHGMRTVGIMSIQPLFHLPCDISLRLNSIIPLIHNRETPDPWIQL
jgi:hypothetical protein